MIYSCFNEKAGHYEYFEDNRTNPVNGDFPVPSLHGRRAGKVGVPARDAGRTLPRDARRTGTGWEARGVLVRCKTVAMRGVSGLGSAEEGIHVGILVVGGALAIYGAFRLYMDSMGAR